MNNDNLDYPEQPMTLSEWIVRKRREFQLLRASVHAQLDAMLDKEELKMEQEVRDSLRDLPVEHAQQQ